MSVPQSRLSTLQDILLIVAVWCGGVVVVDPTGEFPLFDDWAFSRTVDHLLSTGEYDPLNWGWMTLVTNVLWGTLFCLPDGFSFAALRASTLVAAVIGLIGVYVIFRDLQQPRGIAALAVALTGFNPYYFSLAHTFMTEALFTALLVWASIFLIRSLRTGSDLQLIIGSLLAVAATLSRQLALCVPLGFAIALLFKSSYWNPQSVLRAVAPVIACFIAYFAVLWAGMVGVNVNTLVFQSLSDLQKLFQTVAYNTYIVLVYSGLLLFPILLLDTLDQWRRQRARVISLGVFSILIVALTTAAKAIYGVHGREILLPLSSWLVASGVGPVWLYDMVFLKNDNLQPLPATFWIAVTAVALVGAVMLIIALALRTTEIVRGIRRREPLGDAGMVTTFTVLTVIIYFLLLLTAPMTWDRHVVPMIPFVMMAIVGLRTSPTGPWLNVSPPWKAVALALLVLFGLYAVVSTRDYLTWNRIRWLALHELMHDRKIPPQDIDGGFEFNRLYLYDPSDKNADAKLWERRATYVVTFGPVPDHVVVKRYSYQHWMPWHTQTIMVLRRQP
jgi:hypothetical protein